MSYFHLMTFAASTAPLAGDPRSMVAILPTVVAPGTNIVAVRSTVDTDPAPGIQPPRNPYQDTSSTIHTQHTALTGTSMAAPHVSGLCALLIEWWRQRTGGQTPSQAMLKALLVNGTEDCAGGENWRSLVQFSAAPAPNLWPPSNKLQSINTIHP